MQERMKLYLNPECPRFGLTPVRDDGAFDSQRFGELLAMQDKGISISKYIDEMAATKMEETPLVRLKPSPIAGVESKVFECHPLTWDQLPEDMRGYFELAV